MLTCLHRFCASPRRVAGFKSFAVRESNPLSSPSLMRTSLCCVADDLHEIGVEYLGDKTWSDTEAKQRKTQDNRRQRHCLFDPIPSLELFPSYTTCDRGLQTTVAFGSRWFRALLFIFEHLAALHLFHTLSPSICQIPQTRLLQPLHPLPHPTHQLAYVRFASIFGFHGRPVPLCPS